MLELLESGARTTWVRCLNYLSRVLELQKSTPLEFYVTNVTQEKHDARDVGKDDLPSPAANDRHSSSSTRIVFCCIACIGKNQNVSTSAFYGGASQFKYYELKYVHTDIVGVVSS